MNKPSEGVLRPCLGCGVPVTTERKSAGARCPSCDKARKKQAPGRATTHIGSSAKRGYGYSWRKLSKEARRLHPFCMDCGTHEDLTADHLHWPARTLIEVEVVCRSCNSKRGALRKNGKAIAKREPLDMYALPECEGWGVDPVGGHVDRAGGAFHPVTLRADLECTDDECMVMHADSS